MIRECVAADEADSRANLQVDLAFCFKLSVAFIHIVSLSIKIEGEIRVLHFAFFALVSNVHERYIDVILHTRVQETKN